MKRLITALAILSMPVFATVTDTSLGRRIAVADGVALDYSFTFPAFSLSDVAATVVLSGITQGNVYTVSINADQSASPGGNVHFTVAPANTATVTIQRNTPPTQTTVLPPFNPFPAKTVERTFDRVVLQGQENSRAISDLAAKELADVSAIGGGLANPNAIGITATGTPTPVTLADRFFQFNAAQNYGAKADGINNDANAINNALLAGTGTVYLPASPFCYNIGSTTINVPNFRKLQGFGRGGPSAGATCIYYTGSDCAILLDGVKNAFVSDVDVQVDTTNAGARGICLRGAAAVSEFNTLRSVSVRMVNATHRVAGQVGVLLDTTGTGNGVYWNILDGLRLEWWDVSIKLIGNASPFNGANANNLHDIMSWGHNTALVITGNSSDNVVEDFRCSRSDGSATGLTLTCLLLGDATNVAFGNHIYGLMADQGSPSVCATIGAAAGGNVIFASCEAGGPITNNNTTAWPSFIWDSIQSRLSVGKINATSTLTAANLQYGTYTSCTTAATAGATCTSGSANFLQAFADTAYVLACTLKAVTGQPHIVGYTVVNASSFTLTIAADTNVAAGGQFTCIAYHP